ncbi:MAG: hypothetical protein ACREHD_21290, partial [Pirellulales bacterium]
MWRHAIVAFCLSAGIIAGTYRPASAAVTEEQQKQVAGIEQALKEVPALVKAKKADEAEQVVTKAKELLDNLAASDAKVELAITLALLEKKIVAAERLVSKGKAASSKPTPSKTKPPVKPKRNAKNAPKSDEISFTKQIAPIIVGRCNDCHIANTRGGFSMATYASLKKGSAEGGTVFTPGKGEGSRLIEVLQSGDMPRNGGPLKPEEIGLISKWIDSGAKFDGQDENAPIAASAPTTNQPQQPALQVTQASGKESVQFVRDLAPIIVETCIDCHGGMQPRG